MQPTEYIPAPTRAGGTPARGLVSKVPVVTATFWILKILTTGMGEAASDALVRWGGIVAVAVTGLALAASFVVQFRADALRPCRLLAGGGDGRGLRHDGRRHPPLPRHPALDHLRRLPARPSWRSSRSGTGWRGRCRSRASPAAVARPSTGPPWSPRSPWVPPSAT